MATLWAGTRWKQKVRDDVKKKRHTSGASSPFCFPYKVKFALPVIPERPSLKSNQTTHTHLLTPTHTHAHTSGRRRLSGSRSVYCYLVVLGTHFMFISQTSKCLFKNVLDWQIEQTDTMFAISSKAEGNNKTPPLGNTSFFLSRRLVLMRWWIHCSQLHT